MINVVPAKHTDASDSLAPAKPTTLMRMPAIYAAYALLNVRPIIQQGHSKDRHLKLMPSVYAYHPSFFA